MEATEGTLTRVALGDSASLGDLYNARTDKFCGISLFTQTIGPSSSCFTSTDNPFSGIRFVLNDSFSEKMEKLDLSAELKASILAGLVSFEGSGKYLTDAKKSDRSVRNTLNYSITTTTEKLNLFGDELRGLVNTALLDDETITHVATEITWGAKLHVVVEYKAEDDEDITEIKGSLSANLQKFKVSVSGAADVCLNTGDKLRNKNFSLKVYGDVVSNEPLPKTIEEAQDLIRRMPSLVSQSNGGKGKPVRILLVPISRIRRHFALTININTVLYSLAEESIRQLIELFDEILTVKQRLNDLVEDFQSFRNVHSESYGRAKQLLSDLEMEEAGLKARFRETLIAVRNGTKDSASVYELISDYKRKKYSANNVQLEVEEGFDKESAKIELFRALRGQKVGILERGQTVYNLLFIKPNCEWYVFFYKSPVQSAEEETLQQNQSLFLETVRQEKKRQNHEELVDFLFVDLDLSPKCQPTEFLDGSVIQYYKNGKQLSKNLLKDQNKNSVARCSTSLSMSRYTPNKRTFLKVKCPGSCNGPCKNEPTKWQCEKCGVFLEFDFDSFIYCRCGKGPVFDYEFLCNDYLHHGSAYLKYRDEMMSALEFQSKGLRVYKELNILLLGETGVGKSTWINGFSNYVNYNTLEDAEKNEMHCLIPSSFELFDENEKEWKITMGTPHKNERMVTGETATQNPRTYTFPFGEVSLRIIDTPGIGDTRGLEQDKKNFIKIIDHLSNYRKIHGICILLRTNEVRLNVIFEFCIKELLAHLHRDAINNIVFCFTNTRGTMYTPGNSYSSLRKVLQSHANTNFPTATLSSHTVYCMDNEAIRFLAAAKQGMECSYMERQCFATSWETTVEESRRLLKHFQTVKPHKIHDTVTLNQARQSILQLFRALAEISVNIQTNILVLNQRKKELHSLKDNEKKLREKLYVPRVVLNSVNLDHPRTVCTAAKCTESRRFSSQVEGSSLSKTNYKQVCHSHCQIKVVQANQLNCVELKQCWCMKDNHCHQCGCSWEHHMYITYETVETIIEVKCTDTERDLKQTLSTAERAKEMVSACQARVKQLEIEQEIITKASAKFAHFLKEHAITLYNDATLRYMKQLIRAEEEMVRNSGDGARLKFLIKDQDMYTKEIKFLEKEDAKQGNIQVTISDINQTTKELFELRLNGEAIKALFSTS